MKYLASAALIALLGAGAAITAADAQTPKRGGTLVFPVQGEPDSWDCATSSSITGLHRLAPHYSMLVKIDASNYPNIVPDLAESWTISPDQLTYTFKIRSNVKFHDGTPLTSADISTTYERMRKPPQGVVSARQRLFTDIESIATPDAQTVVFKLARPNASMMTVFASPWNCIYSAKLLQSNPNYPGKLVMGSGAFQFTAYTPGGEWTGKRFDGYFQAGKPYLDGFRAVDADRQGIVNALAAGQIHAEFRGLTDAERDRIVQQRGNKVRIEEGPWTIGSLITANEDKPPFNDVRVRQAMTMAIDRWGNADAMGKVNMTPYIGGFLRPGYEYATPIDELQKFPGFSKDIEKSRAEARRLLAEAGQSDLSFTLSNRDNQVPLGVFIIDQWSRVGITVKQDLLNSPQFAALRSSRNYSVLIDSSNEFIDDPNIQLSKYLSKDLSSANVGNYTDRTLDDLYQKQATAKTKTERLAAVREFDARMLNQVHSFIIYWFKRTISVDASMHGYYLVPSYQVGQDLTDVWLDQ